MRKNEEIICKSKEIDKLIESLSVQILEHNPSASKKLAIVGIQTHGVTLAKRIKEIVSSRTGIDIPLGLLDITLYRDDLDSNPTRPVVKGTSIDFDITDRFIILVDDVLYTGRTTRAAIDELIDFGRPASIKLAVLIDRGHRELPIQPDYIGKRIETKESDFVEVVLSEETENDRVILIRK
jgi:pyrimidine operon attenuation protein/uracil phosphoribosyltransferase